ncbi:hypothetical protein ACWCTD_13835 [Streptomyces sp. NPDC001499]
MAIGESVLVTGKLGCAVGTGDERTSGGPPSANEPHRLLHEVVTIQGGTIELLVTPELDHLRGVPATVVEGLAGPEPEEDLATVA